MKIIIYSLPIFALVVIGSTVAIRTFDGDYENQINTALPETVRLREMNRIRFAKKSSRNHRLKSASTLSLIESTPTLGLLSHQF